MDELELKLIIQTLRRAWNRYPARYAAMNRCKLRYGIYKCEGCDAPFQRRQIQVDHIIPVIPLTGFDNIEGVVLRLFCKETGLRVLCKPCHQKITSAQNVVRREQRKKKKGETDG